MRTLMVAVLAAAMPLGAQVTSGTFVAAEVCSDCHSRLYAPGVAPNWEGMRIVHHGERAAAVDARSVAPYALWSASMMAHAAKDPYWQAKVKEETALTPAAAAEIEDACLSCHAPTQQYESRGKGGMRMAALNAAGREGVGCTVCHQIDPANLGSPESFTAGFRINTRREIYGPHQNPFPMPMRMHTGRTPTYSAHMLEAAVCGTCHVVVTPTLDAAGRKVGEFLEQATYLEWAASGHAKAGKTCQSCHMPQLTDAAGKPARQYIAHTPHGGYFGPIRPREPWGQHAFGAANVQMLGVLAEQDPAKAELLGNAAARARRRLEEGLTLQVEARRRGGRIEAEVRLGNAAGHKYPSGYPGRRLWLHVAVKDAQGRVRFESGGWNEATGEIRALEGRAARVERHHERITSAAQTQVYEMAMGEPGGALTRSLMRAGVRLKDNRLLPSGFADADGRLEAVGVGKDPDFAAGGDRVVYEARAAGAGPWTVEVEALYQSVRPADFAAGRHKAPVVVRRAEVVVREW